MATANGDASSREPEVTLAEIAALVAEFPGPDLEAATKVLERDRVLDNIRQRNEEAELAPLAEAS